VAGVDTQPPLEKGSKSVGHAQDGSSLPGSSKKQGKVGFLTLAGTHVGENCRSKKKTPNVKMGLLHRARLLVKW